MHRLFLPTFLLVLLLPQPGLIRADAFDHYINETLVKVAKAKGAEQLKKLTPDLMVKHSRALPGITGTFVVVETNDGRMSKLLVQPARQKISDDKSVPILLIERF